MQVDLDNHPAVSDGSRPKDGENGRLLAWLCEQAVHDELLVREHVRAPRLSLVRRVSVGIERAFLELMGKIEGVFLEFAQN